MTIRPSHILAALLALLIILAIWHFWTSWQGISAPNRCAIECAEKGYARWIIAPFSGECECRGGKA